MIDETALNVFVDGAARPGRRGGIGIHFVYVDDSGDECVEDMAPPGYKGATIGEMELQACIVALEETKRFLKMREFSKIILYSDSNYVVKYLYYAKAIWPLHGWKRATGAPVLNKRIWTDLKRAVRNAGKVVVIKKVSGHSSDQHNRKLIGLRPNRQRTR